MKIGHTIFWFRGWRLTIGQVAILSDVKGEWYKLASIEVGNKSFYRCTKKHLISLPFKLPVSFISFFNGE